MNVRDLFKSKKRLEEERVDAEKYIKSLRKKYPYDERAYKTVLINQVIDGASDALVNGESPSKLRKRLEFYFVAQVPPTMMSDVPFITDSPYLREATPREQAIRENHYARITRENTVHDRIRMRGWKNEEWYKKAIPTLIKVFNANADKLDGLKLSGGMDAHQEYHTILTIKSRPDGKFNVHVYNQCTVADANEDRGIYTNRGKGYSAEDLFSGTQLGEVDLSSDNPQERKYLLKEVKNRTGIDLKREVRETVQTKKERKDLEGRILSLFATLSTLFGIFFLSSKLTGNVIADLPTKTTSFIGGGFLIIALVAGLFYLRARKK